MAWNQGPGLWDGVPLLQATQQPLTRTPQHIVEITQLGPFQPGPQYKRGRGRSFFRDPPKKGAICQVPGCDRSLHKLRDYYKRYKICPFHLELPCLVVEGQSIRFCQQCGRYQLLSDFDGDRRSCRRKLVKHNARRRKAEAQAGEGGEGEGGGGGGGGKPRRQRQAQRDSGDSGGEDEAEEDAEEELQRGSPGSAVGGGGGGGGNRGRSRSNRGRGGGAGAGGRGASPQPGGMGLGNLDPAIVNLLSFVAGDHDVQRQVPQQMLQGLQGLQGLTELSMGRGGGGPGLPPWAPLPPDWLPGFQGGPGLGPGPHPGAGAFPYMNGPGLLPPQQQQAPQQVMGLRPGLGGRADMLMGQPDLAAARDPGLLPYLPPQQQQQQQGAVGPGDRPLEMLAAIQAQAELLQVGAPPPPQQAPQLQPPMLVARPMPSGSSRAGVEAGVQRLGGRAGPGAGGANGSDGSAGNSPPITEPLESNGLPPFRQQLSAGLASLLAAHRGLAAAEGEGGGDDSSGQLRQQELGAGPAGKEAAATLWLQGGNERSKPSGDSNNSSFQLPGGPGGRDAASPGLAAALAAAGATGEVLRWAEQAIGGGGGGKDDGRSPSAAATADCGAGASRATVPLGREGSLRGLEISSGLPLPGRAGFYVDGGAAPGGAQRSAGTWSPLDGPAAQQQQAQAQQAQQPEGAGEQWEGEVAGGDAKRSRRSTPGAGAAPSRKGGPITQSPFEAAMLGFGPASAQPGAAGAAGVALAGRKRRADSREVDLKSLLGANNSPGGDEGAAAGAVKQEQDPAQQVQQRWRPPSRGDRVDKPLPAGAAAQQHQQQQRRGDLEHQRGGGNGGEGGAPGQGQGPGGPGQVGSEPPPMLFHQHWGSARQVASGSAFTRVGPAVQPAKGPLLPPGGSSAAGFGNRGPPGPLNGEGLMGSRQESPPEARRDAFLSQHWGSAQQAHAGAGPLAAGPPPPQPMGQGAGPSSWVAAGVAPATRSWGGPPPNPFGQQQQQQQQAPPPPQQFRMGGGPGGPGAGQQRWDPYLAQQAAPPPPPQHPMQELSRTAAVAVQNAAGGSYNPDAVEAAVHLVQAAAQDPDPRLAAQRLLTSLQRGDASSELLQVTSAATGQPGMTSGLLHDAVGLLQHLLGNGQGAFQPNQQLVTVSLKLYQCTPDQLPPEIRRELENWLATSRTFVEEAMRPGCVHLTATALLEAEEANALCTDLCGRVQKLLSRDGSSGFGSHVAGCVLVQHGNEAVVVVNGEPLTCLDLIAGSRMAPHLTAVQPLAVTPGYQETFILRGWGIAGSHNEVFCRHRGSYPILAVLDKGTYQCTADAEEGCGKCSPLEWVELQTPAEEVGAYQLDAQQGRFVGTTQAAFVVVPDAEAVAELRQLEVENEGIDDVPGFVQQVGLVLQYLEEVESGGAQPSTAQGDELLLPSFLSYLGLAGPSSPSSEGVGAGGFVAMGGGGGGSRQSQFEDAAVQRRMAALAQQLCLVCVRRRWPALLRLLLPAVMAGEEMMPTEAEAGMCKGLPAEATLLHVAVCAGSVEVVRALQEWGEKVGHCWQLDVAAFGGVTPLHMLATMEDSVELALAVTDLSSDGPGIWTRTSGSGTGSGVAMSALRFAALRGNRSLLRALSDAGLRAAGRLLANPPPAEAEAEPCDVAGTSAGAGGQHSQLRQRRVGAAGREPPQGGASGSGSGVEPQSPGTPGSSVPKAWGTAWDIEEDSETDSDCSDAGSSVMEPQELAVTTVRLLPWGLAAQPFAQPQTERRFAQFQARRLLKLDALTLVLLALFHLVFSLAPIEGPAPAPLGGWLAAVAAWLPLLVLALLVLTRPGKRLYYMHRELFVLGAHACLLTWQHLATWRGALMPELLDVGEVGQMLLPSAMWLLYTALALQVRLVYFWQLRLAITAFDLLALLPQLCMGVEQCACMLPAWVPALLPSHWHCVALVVAKQLVLGFALPVVAVALMELRMRQAFCTLHSPQEKRGDEGQAVGGREGSGGGAAQQLPAEAVPMGAGPSRLGRAERPAERCAAL